ncbi:MAG: efflux RND transporter periplasmic adaptor subunit [Anaerolineae bacterium]|jgi:multidrug resistance efflux pump|nr:efflux RND transporter periplasmic adaptor subunit [Anaerolineae bacterium]
MSKKIVFKFLAILVLTLSIAACAGNGNDEALTASGTISTTSLDISPELGGRIEEIYVEAGDTVSAGDALFRIDDEVMQAQYDQAAAAVASAEAGYNTAVEQVKAAKLQLNLAEQGARYDEIQLGSNPAATTWPDDFFLPEWYFQPGEELSAVKVELEDAQDWLTQEKQNLDEITVDINEEDFTSLESDIAAAEQTYLIAQQTLFQFSLPGADEALQELAQDQFDAASNELEALQLELDRVLSDTTLEELLNARGRVLLAQTRVDAAQLKLDSLLVGEDSLLVASAEANVKLAEAQVEQAQAGVDQAKAALRLLEIQLEKTTIYSPMNGTIMSESLEVGQLVGAGMTTMTIAKLDTVELTVYVPEDKYGVINLGDVVEVTVDSYIGTTYTGTVEYIADEAEFTPRNVQTVEGRKATVYAIRISLPNPDQQLKPGMPADVTFLD